MAIVIVNIPTIQSSSFIQASIWDQNYDPFPVKYIKIVADDHN